jgi:hypothetical protein
MSLNIRLFGAAFIFAAMAISAPVYAHHSLASYNAQITEKVVGTVTAYEWRNPHVLIEVQPADSENIDHAMLFESADINRSMRMGWTADSLRVGDVVLITYNPARGDRTRGHMVQAETARGETFSLQIFRRELSSANGPGNSP